MAGSRGALSIVAALAIALIASGATAQEGEPEEGSGDRTSSLSWVRLPGAESCATAPELARAVETRLSRPVFVAPRNADLTVEGRVAPRDGGGFTATFAIATATGTVLGERELLSEAEDCADLTATVAFVVAVMIDPDAEERATETEIETETETEIETETETETEIETETDVDRRPGWSGEIDAGVGLAVGLLPEPAIGGFGAILLQTPWFIAAEIDASIYPYSPQSTATGDANWLAAFGGFFICTGALTIHAFGLRGCVGGQLGFLRIQGAVDPPQDHVAGHVLVRLRLSYRLFKGLIIWTRPSLAINPRIDPYVHEAGGVVQSLHSPETVAGIFDLGVGWLFD